jgi:hypothetical protein
LSASGIAPGLFAGPGSGCAALGRRELDAGSTGLRQTDGDCLFRGSRAMFAFADVLDLFADELSGLRRWRFAFARILARALEGFSLRQGCTSFDGGMHNLRPHQLVI